MSVSGGDRFFYSGAQLRRACLGIESDFLVFDQLSRGNNNE